MFLVVSVTAGQDGRCSDEFLTKINPNNASAYSLVRLEGVGMTKAFAIVEYRENKKSGDDVFRCPDDLTAVKGIGVKTVEKNRKSLFFK